MANKCTARKKNGDSCSAEAQIGKDVCVFHDPEKVQLVRRARQAGGVKRSQRAAVLPPNTPDYPLENALQVSELLQMSMNKVLRGELDSGIAYSVGNLANILLRCLEQGSYIERLNQLEARIKAIKDNSGEGHTCD